ncbi:MOSC domain protein [Geosmithia morbida]|uniref:MOSC domain protein n=1 Tax=Geosmithia morbida TaxID=1094350 RepID=A0A9P4Z3T1_9HYPO|nr:MOSC domain protein [Geosmithia morbida]KAF4126733.1 MOSC domain protein [Geosmithia morbida]
MLNVDQETGVRHKFEPDRSLRRFRDVDQGAPRWGCMGMQLCPLFANAADENSRQSVLEVGMKISVLETGSHLYIPQ